MGSLSSGRLQETSCLDSGSNPGLNAYVMKVRELELRRSKTFRDAVTKWGEPSVPRRRIIVAPPMADMIAKDVSLSTLRSQIGCESNLTQENFSRPEKDDVSHLIRKLSLRGKMNDTLIMMQNMGKPETNQSQDASGTFRGIVLPASMNLSTLIELSKLRSIRKVRLAWFDACDHYDAGIEKQYLELLDKFRLYNEWLHKQKTVRNDLDNLDLSPDWLLKKADRTPLEDRVLERLLPPLAESEARGETPKGPPVHRIPTPPPLSKAQMQLLPLLQQPIPVALSILAEYCVTNRLRLLDLFVQIDKDKDWHISRDEFIRVIKNRQIPLAKGQIDDLIIALDTDNNDKLNYQELARGVEAYKIDDRWQKIKELLELQKQMMENDGSNDSAVPLSSLQHSQRKRSTVRPQSSATSGDVDSGSEQSDSSLDFLKLPQVDTNENVDISEKQVKERRVKKHREKKDKVKLKQKRPKSTDVPPTTIRGDIQEVKDRYAGLMLKHTTGALDRMHTSGMPVKTETVKRVVLFPYDKPVEECRAALRQPGLYTMSKSMFLKDEDLLLNKSKEKRGRRKRRERDRFRSDHNNSGIRHSGRSASVDLFWSQRDNRTIYLEDLEKGRATDSVFQRIQPHYCL